MQTPGSWQIMTMIFVGAWISQFIGHGAFEGRAPALLDSLVQCKFSPSSPSAGMLINIGSALVLANFFVFYEVLFKLGFVSIAFQFNGSTKLVAFSAPFGRN
jgi:uncharacterized membrane protein YGL010W